MLRSPLEWDLFMNACEDLAVRLTQVVRVDSSLRIAQILQSDSWEIA